MMSKDLSLSLRKALLRGLDNAHDHLPLGPPLHTPPLLILILAPSASSSAAAASVAAPLLHCHDGHRHGHGQRHFRRCDPPPRPYHLISSPPPAQSSVSP